jgi:hypothetical protein
MLAMMILVVLALGVAAYIYYGRAGVYAQRDRLTVLELVKGRMELLRATDFEDVKPPSEDYSVYWMRPPRNGNTRWRFYSSRARQRLNVNSRRYLMTTTVQYVDVDGGTTSYDALKFIVSMRYRTGSTDEITLSTYRAHSN